MGASYKHLNIQGVWAWLNADSSHEYSFCQQ